MIRSCALLPFQVAVGFTHASNVMEASLSLSYAVLVTLWEVPLKVRAEPNLPLVVVPLVPDRVLLLALSVRSAP